MSVQVELLVHHGGRMQFNGRAAHYAGGEVVEVTFDSDFLCYFQLIKLGTEDLQYDSVDRIWYVAPGKTLSNGLVRVLSDADAVKLCEAGKEGVVEVYLDTTAVESCYGNNEELESEWHNGLSGSDPEAEVSTVAANVGVVHLIDDVGFSCLRKGFLKGCRKIFVVDGCFLKGEVKGMILTAVGKDGNHQMFPIAWAVVEGENRDSWGWFIEIIQEELNLERRRIENGRRRTE
ncbi:hypothetical protein LINPERHAP2_LOCUS21242 [Linum perenne]